MLKGTLLHPELLKALAAAGHGSQVLVADGNYPMATRVRNGAAVIYLNLRPGLVKATDVLQTIAEHVPIQEAYVMQPEDGSEPVIFAEFARLLGGVPLERVDRASFYGMASGPNLAVAVATGEERVFGNILLTIGVVSRDQ